jgi:hypothetical protein
MGVLDPGHFLISCPECGAWPMAANVRSAWRSPPREVTFVCGPCGCQEAAAVSVSGQLVKITHLSERRAPHHPRRAPWPAARDR